MFFYFLRRLGLLITTLLVINLIAWSLEVNLVLKDTYNGEFFNGFVDFIQQNLNGNLGFNNAGLPILSELGRTFPATLELCFTSFIIAMIIGIPLGTLAGISENNSLKPIIITLSQLFFSIPLFWLALLSVSYVSLKLGWLPVSGRISIIYEIPQVSGFLLVDTLLSDTNYRWSAIIDAIKHLALPSIILAIIPTTEVIRLLSSSTSEVMKQNYIKAAATKGLSKWQIIRRHTLRNSFPPILPRIGLQFGSVLTMAMVIETVFAWPGIGNLLIHSIYLQDYKAISGSLLIISSFVICTSVFIDLVTVTLHPLMRKEIYGQ